MTTDTQPQLMAFDPATGEPKPYPSHAGQWRDYHSTVAWLFNPWTGTRRLAADVGTDPLGRLVLPASKINRIFGGGVLSDQELKKLMAINAAGLPQHQQGAAEQGWNGVIRGCNPNMPAPRPGQMNAVDFARAALSYGRVDAEQIKTCDPTYCPKARLDAASGNAQGAYPDPLK